VKPDLHFVSTAIETSETPDTTTAMRGRSLGSAIILAAIRAYASQQAEVHESAASFLYPQTCEWRAQYEWAVALADGLNPAWLRDALDRSRRNWDAQRSAHRRLSRCSRKLSRGIR
jgi:hypothetical protein